MAACTQTLADLTGSEEARRGSIKGKVGVGEERGRQTRAMMRTRLDSYYKVCVSQAERLPPRHEGKTQEMAGNYSHYTAPARRHQHHTRETTVGIQSRVRGGGR